MIKYSQGEIIIDISTIDIAEEGGDLTLTTEENNKLKEALKLWRTKNIYLIFKAGGEFYKVLLQKASEDGYYAIMSYGEYDENQQLDSYVGVKIVIDLYSKMIRFSYNEI